MRRRKPFHYCASAVNSACIWLFFEERVSFLSWLSHKQTIRERKKEWESNRKETGRQRRVSAANSNSMNREEVIFTGEPFGWIRRDSTRRGWRWKIFSKHRRKSSSLWDLKDSHNSSGSIVWFPASLRSRRQNIFRLRFKVRRLGVRPLWGTEWRHSNNGSAIMTRGGLEISEGWAEKKSLNLGKVDFFWVSCIVRFI